MDGAAGRKRAEEREKVDKRKSEEQKCPGPGHPVLRDGKRCHLGGTSPHLSHNHRDPLTPATEKLF